MISYVSSSFCDIPNFRHVSLRFLQHLQVSGHGIGADGGGGADGEMERYPKLVDFSRGGATLL